MEEGEFEQGYRNALVSCVFRFCTTLRQFFCLCIWLHLVYSLSFSERKVIRSIRAQGHYVSRSANERSVIPVLFRYVESLQIPLFLCVTKPVHIAVTY